MRMYFWKKAKLEQKFSSNFHHLCSNALFPTSLKKYVLSLLAEKGEMSQAPSIFTKEYICRYMYVQTVTDRQFSDRV